MTLIGEAKDKMSQLCLRNRGERTKANREEPMMKKKKASDKRIRKIHG